MNTIGGFREGEIDGKPFHIYTLLSKNDNPISSSGSDEATIDSNGDNDLPLQPLFLCPSLRFKVHELKYKEYNPSKYFLPFNTSPHFPNTRNADQEVQYLLDSNIHNGICKLPVLPLFWCNNKSDTREYQCGACLETKHGTGCYLCVTCSLKFHKECVESPLEIKHPSHPSHPFLSLILYSPPYGLVPCICSGGIAQQNIMYYCPTYKLSMHPVCAMKPIPLIINHPKRHPHSLSFFPKQASLPCDVCGLIKELIPTYVCVQCVFVVHQECIYFPNVLKISRHHHRISFTSSLPYGKWSCGVCRKNIDNYCGAYSCNKCSDYFVHTRCALREDVWDGVDLEGVPEEPETNVEPFETIADGIILHFSHGHHLKLEISRVYDEDKFCQACILPIYEGKYYSCMDQCDFILHEKCANAPLKKHHALLPHPLTLKVVTDGYEDIDGSLNCNACWRISCGFVYEYRVGYWSFKLDLRCASISEPFEYQGHEHPLFLALKPEEERSAICKICQEDGDGNNHFRKLNCIECNYVICFRCATLPYKARYKHDKHFLTFRKGKEASDQLDWCDVCESRVVYSRKGGFYACDDCCTTLHVDCLLGTDPYMKPGQTIFIARKKAQILSNNTLSRPFCHLHGEDRCPYRVVFKKENMTFCSLNCYEN